MYCLVINCMTLNILFGAIRTVIIAIIYKTRTFMRWYVLFSENQPRSSPYNPENFFRVNVWELSKFL